MRITTIVLGYRRAILIAVYTHLLRELAAVDGTDTSARRRKPDVVALGQHCALPECVEP